MMSISVYARVVSEMLPATDFDTEEIAVTVRTARHF